MLICFMNMIYLFWDLRLKNLIEFIIKNILIIVKKIFNDNQMNSKTQTSTKFKNKIKESQQ